MTNIPETEFLSRLSQVKLLALDVDGVLTDGGLYYTETGEELKKFNVKDGLGLKLIMQAGIEVAIISAGFSTTTIHRAKRLEIQHTFIGVADKLSTLKQLCEQLDIPLAQVAYIGDDTIDLEVMGAVGCPITVADAMPENQALAIYQTRLAGGQGAVREVCELMLKTKRN